MLIEDFTGIGKKMPKCTHSDLWAVTFTPTFEGHDGSQITNDKQYFSTKTLSAV